MNANTRQLFLGYIVYRLNCVYVYQSITIQHDNC